LKVQGGSHISGIPDLACEWVSELEEWREMGFSTINA
jgi:hypothetical protein